MSGAPKPMLVRATGTERECKTVIQTRDRLVAAIDAFLRQDADDYLGQHRRLVTARERLSRLALRQCAASCKQCFVTASTARQYCSLRCGQSVLQAKYRRARKVNGNAPSVERAAKVAAGKDARQQATDAQAADDALYALGLLMRDSETEWDAAGDLVRLTLHRDGRRFAGADIDKAAEYFLSGRLAAAPLHALSEGELLEIDRLARGVRAIAARRSVIRKGGSASDGG